ncbi:MAG: leucyl aminopeptidase [Alphaproteobacteria bacterium GWC2_42_16]|nr:MAG: leucyl aminopeptidase [Alphaproteobacteria bacterium GWC2_42_16]OFW73095.1 MAG: leucyl aminopeptidase [Alphaproteobacteria bacterium GWA2_41_27]OFW81669.1 MAG: leucyl aminopeptidase [Alphaproteobacteria bacterium RIFCSPHIGHO2_12_FULL_42_100]OFW85311.1 MAG: leucyl aminopeptidase [Alphaproteobacteria bacterium RBG_16_42_14]OFW90569.1 MAG: leucyl aminopeptidase [Alphaproteobacteria bacterium RIFCSPHIGHO2_02_FULL_42_30]OFW91419.1 MAG: leucyl aminopeptidase [Alphaproteobacteria bacterium RI
MKVEFKKPTTAQVVCLGVYEGNQLPEPTLKWDKKLKGLLSESLKKSRFKGKFNQSLTVFSQDGTQFILIGLGKTSDLNETQWTKIGGAIAHALTVLPSGEAAVEIYDLKGCKNDLLVAHLAYGALLKSWRFEKYFTTKSADELFSLKKISFFTPAPGDVERLFKPLAAIAEGVFLTRSVVSEPGNVIIPETLAKIAETLKKDGVKVEVLDVKDMKKLGMNALLGVGQGSVHEPKLVIMQWEGGAKKEAPLAFVGKGVTFDTGGISIKPAQNMEEMKYDMAGAGVVIGLMKALACRKAKVNAVGVIGLVENMPSGSAQRPGDIVKTMSGQTIEVLNTDAEGRLVLADALWYTQNRFKPQFMVDLATLTGAMIICLGNERAGLFSIDEALSKKLMTAGEKVGELLWPFPMDESYDKEIDSEIADVRNISIGRGAGSITAAKFLQRFTNKVPWAHLDIAGTAWASKDLPLCAKGASAFGVRLLDRFVSNNYEK